MKKNLILLIVMTLLISTGCTKAGLQEEVIFETGKDHVLLIHETDKEGKIVPKGFDHPTKFTVEQMDKILSRIFYSEYMFFKYRGRKKVFIESERSKLSGYISQALAQATPVNWIKFAVTSIKRDLLLPTRRLTSGYIFIKDNKFNIVLGNLNFELSDEDTPFSGDPRTRWSIPSISLIEEDGVVFPLVDKSSKFLKRPHNNWLVMDAAKVLKGTIADPVVKEPVTPEVRETPAPVEEKTLEQRLMELKSLYEKGLITQEDYEERKKELLEEL